MPCISSAGALKLSVLFLKGVSDHPNTPLVSSRSVGTLLLELRSGLVEPKLELGARGLVHGTWSFPGVEVSAVFREDGRIALVVDRRIGATSLLCQPRKLAELSYHLGIEHLLYG